MIRKSLVTVVAALALVATAAPASARPVPDEPRYNGPCVACKFAGVKVSGKAHR